MNRLISIFTVNILVIATVLGFYTFSSNNCDAGNIIHVGTGPGNTTSSIQDAIDNYAIPGDTIYVHKGTYNENLLIDKTLNLTGEDKEVTIIDGGYVGDVIHATANWVNITGFTITNGSYGIYFESVSNGMISGCNVDSNSDEGIFLFSSSNNTVSLNNISNNYYGIHIRESSNDNLVFRNEIFNNSINGIYLSKLSSNKIKNNTVKNNGGNGIYLYSTKNVSVENNEFSSNSIGVYSTASSENNIMTKNNISDNQYGLYFGLSFNNTITENSILHNTYHGIWIYSSSKNNSIKNCNISFNSRHGIYLSLSVTNNTIEKNDISNNVDGINLSSSSNNTIYHNNIFNNLNDGIHVLSSSNNTIIKNDISNNWRGINLVNSSDNQIYHNNILSNSNQAYDDSTGENQWDDGYPSGGNHWSDWISPDTMTGPNQNITGSDGIVDNPYQIDLDSQDNYPLTEPIDKIPPVITNLQPPDQSITNNSQPTISADYSDYSGINITSVLLFVNLLNVILNATITASNITYTPESAMIDGSHTIYLEVGDVNGNLATESWSFDIDATPPGSINDLVISQTTSDSITLSWTAPGDDNDIGSAEGYIIKYSTSGPITDSNWHSANIYSQSWVPLSAGETESHVIVGLSQGTLYWFAIKAYDDLQNYAEISNSPSESTLTLPSAPQNPHVISGDSFVNLTWDPPSADGGSSITGYNIYRNDTNGIFNTVAGSQRWYNNTNVINGIDYIYNISAQNIVGEGPFSLDINARPMTVPSAPQNPHALAGNGYVNLSWNNPSSNGGSPIIDFLVYRAIVSGSETFLTEVGKLNYYNDSNVTNGITYYYKLKAKNAAGEGSFSNEVNATPATVPSPPNNLQFTAGDSYVNLTWNPPASDGGSSISGYIIYRGTVSEEEIFLGEVDNILFYNDTNVVNDDTYYYKVSAKNALGESQLSNEVNATPKIILVSEDAHDEEFPWLWIFTAPAICILVILLIFGFVFRRKKENLKPPI